MLFLGFNVASCCCFLCLLLLEGLGISAQKFTLVIPGYVRLSPTAQVMQNSWLVTNKLTSPCERLQ